MKRNAKPANCESVIHWGIGGDLDTMPSPDSTAKSLLLLGVIELALLDEVEPEIDSPGDGDGLLA